MNYVYIFLDTYLNIYIPCLIRFIALSDDTLAGDCMIYVRLTRLLGEFVADGIDLIQQYIVIVKKDFMVRIL